jgi:hypothetical protein
LSAHQKEKQRLCLEKIEMNSRTRRPIFFSFCDAASMKVSNWAIFLYKSHVLQVAISPPHAILNRRISKNASRGLRRFHCTVEHRPAIVSRIAPPACRQRRLVRADSNLFTMRWRVRARNRPRGYPRRSRARLTGCMKKSMNKIALRTMLVRRLVERRGCVCYFLKARGVAQLGSAPALGAGGRPFKSARPDTRQ